MLVPRPGERTDCKKNPHGLNDAGKANKLDLTQILAEKSVHPTKYLEEGNDEPAGRFQVFNAV